MEDAEKEKKWAKDGPAITAIMREESEMIRDYGGMENYVRHLNMEMEREHREREGGAGYYTQGGYNGPPPAYTQQQRRPPVNTYRGERFYE